jgi:cytoskeletal protein CcmA (bactofilin family)
VRIAGRFKGDINVRGDLTIENGAKVNGSVRAERVTVAGELTGNIENAQHVELLQTGALTGDVKSKTFSVAKGSRMRGHAEFGWEDDKAGVTDIHKNNGSGQKQ